MAMQAQNANQEPDSRTDLRQEGASNDLKHCEGLGIQGDKMKQKSSQSGHSISADESRCSDAEDAEGVCAQPPLKRLRLQTDRHRLRALVADDQKPAEYDDGQRQLNTPVIGDKQTCNSLIVTKLVDDSENNEQIDAVNYKAGMVDSAHDAADANEAEEEESDQCVTPKAGQHRIPDSKDLVCPPPPIKRKPTAFKRIIISTRLHSACNSNNRANFLINPPDLHTYPDCIRSLFDK